MRLTNNIDSAAFQVAYQETSKGGHESFLCQFPYTTKFFLINLLETAKI